jgi:hypothetical protein
MGFLEQAFFILGVVSALGIFLLVLSVGAALIYLYLFSRYAEQNELGEGDVAREQLLEEESKVEVLEPWERG